MRLIFRIAVFAALLLVALTAPARADVPTGKDPAGWSRTAATAESWLKAYDSKKTAPTLDQWQDLRITLTVERELARGAADKGTLDTKILLAQLAGLGPKPATGATEDAWVAARRSQINAALVKAETPVQVARDAQARATVLIEEIDVIIGQKNRAALFARKQSLFEPAFWNKVAAEIENFPASFRLAQPPTIVSAPNSRLHIGTSVALALLALLVAAFAHRWVFAVAAREGHSAKENLGFAFLKDIADIALPMLIILMVFGVLGWSGMPLVMPPGLGVAVVTAGAIAIYLHWLGHSIFRPSFAPGRVIALPEREAKRAVAITTALGIVLAAESLLAYAEGLHIRASALFTLIALLVIFGASASLWLLTAMWHPPIEDAGPHRSKPKPVFDLVLPATRLLKFAAIASPLAAMVGYVPLSRNFLMASIYSVAAIFAAIFFFRSITKASEILFERFASRAGPSWQFVPLVFGFALVVLTLPVVAMMWGVSIDAILDWILALKNGVEVGQVRISFGNVVTFAFVFMVGYFITRWTQRLVQLALFPRLRVDHGAKAATLTGVGYVGLTLSAMVAITAAGLDLSSLAFVAGALSVGIGFGLQSVVSNFVSGIILLIERPVKEGDWIEVGNVAGHVRRIAFRSTYIQTSDLHEVIIPNSQLVSGSVTNFSYGGSEGRISLSVGIAYAADMNAAKQALIGAAAAHPDVIASPEPIVRMDGFGENSVNLLLLCFVDDVDRRSIVKSDLYFAIFETLKKADIEIPFPQRDIRIRSEGGEVKPAKRAPRKPRAPKTGSA